MSGSVTVCALIVRGACTWSNSDVGSPAGAVSWCSIVATIVATVTCAIIKISAYWRVTAIVFGIPSQALCARSTLPEATQLSVNLICSTVAAGIVVSRLIAILVALLIRNAALGSVNLADSASDGSVTSASSH